MARKKEFIMSKDVLAYEEPIDRKFLNVKRTYMLRASTVRKLNELKRIHPNLNTLCQFNC
jgi:hypothetical protein